MNLNVDLYHHTPMNLNVDLYHHPDQATAAQLDRIENTLGFLKDTQEEIMATLEDIQALQADTDVKVAAVSADVTALLEKLANFPPAGLTAEQQAAIDDIAAHGAKVNDGLAAIDSAAKA